MILFYFIIVRDYCVYIMTLLGLIGQLKRYTWEAVKISREKGSRYFLIEITKKNKRREKQENKRKTRKMYFSCLKNMRIFFS